MMTAGTVPGRRVRRALEDSGPVALGAVPTGVAFGVLVAQSGLAWWWASVFSGLIYAGSLEFLFLGLVLASAPLGTVAVTAFLVNVRHVFYALSFPLHRVRGRLGRAYSTFALSDEAYAIAASPAGASFDGGRVLWSQAFVHLYWAGGATAGALLGTVVPGRVTGLDFAVTALFTVLALDAVRAPGRGWSDVAGAALAGVCALVARFVLPGQLLPAAFALFTTALLARYVWGRARA